MRRPPASSRWSTRSSFSIADIVYKESDIGVGDVAQTLGDGRAVKSAVKKCGSDCLDAQRL